MKNTLQDGRPTVHRELVANNDQISFSTDSVTATEPEGKDAAEREVGEAKKHPQMLAGTTEPCSRAKLKPKY